MDKVINVYDPWSDSVQQYTPYGVGDYDGALAYMSVDKNGNTAWTVPMLDNVTVTASPGKNMKNSDGNYINMSDPYYAQRVGDSIGDGINNFLIRNMYASLMPFTVGVFQVPKALKDAYYTYKIARTLDKNIKKFDGTVDEEYFRDPNSWYRITTRPEIQGIQEEGRNITTNDNPDIAGTANRWRVDVQHNQLYTRDGSWYRPNKRRIQLNKDGAAHGNKSQASVGQPWKGTTSDNPMFPGGYLEGRRVNKIAYGRTRTDFHYVPWESVRTDGYGRIGFNTGDMPIDGLTWWQRLPNGRYKGEPVIPFKRIKYE